MMITRKKKIRVVTRAEHWIDYELGTRFLCSVPEVRVSLQRAGLVVDGAGFEAKRWTEKEATGSEPWKNLLKNGLWFYFQ